VKTATAPPPDDGAEPPGFKFLINDGVIARKMGDQSNWRLGELALVVEATYADIGCTLKRYADKIGVPYASLRSTSRSPAPTSNLLTG
jgi:hypothetical protein